MLTDTNTSAIMDPITATISMAEALQVFKVREAEGFVCVCGGGGGGGGQQQLKGIEGGERRLWNN